MSNNTLTEILASSNRLESLLIENGGELTPEIEKEFFQLELSKAQKVDGYSFMIQRLNMNCDYWAAKAAVYSNIAKSCRNAQARLKDRIKYTMIETKTDEVCGKESKFKICNAAKRLVIDSNLVPRKYKMEVTTIVDDKVRIKADLLVGKKIKGAELQGGKQLRMTSKKVN